MPVQKVAVALFITLGLVGIVAIAASFFDQLACEGQPLNHEFIPFPEQQIWGERVVSQSFVAPRNGLSRISVMFLTYQRRNTQDVTLRLLEIPAEVDNPLLGSEQFRTTFNASRVSDQEWLSFTFPPILDSMGKSYLISLQSLESEPGNALATGGIQKDVYKPGLAYLGYVPLPADLTFQSCYELTVKEKFQVLFEQMTRNRPALAGNINFYLGWLLVYILLLVGFFWRLIKLAL